MDAPGVRRFHFHVLMLSIHQSLHRIRMMRGTDNPINVLSSELASSARLFFIDEVEITDVADASLLNRLHDAILKKGASFFFTSNSAPEQLYKGGLNVGIFQPSFANRVRASGDVFCLDDPFSASQDYRMINSLDKQEKNKQHPFYLKGEEGKRLARHVWASLSLMGTSDERKNVQVSVSSTTRYTLVPVAAGKAARFSFMQLCGSNSTNSSADFCALLSEFDAVLVEDVPTSMLLSAGGRGGRGRGGEGDASPDELRRFVNFVDLAYERGTLLILSGCDSDLPLPLPPPLTDSSSSSSSSSSSPSASSSSIFVTGVGGASGRSTTMMSAEVEWSATGLTGRSLAGLATSSFSQRAMPRMLSRMQEMMSSQWAVSASPHAHAQTATVSIQLRSIEASHLAAGILGLG